MPLVGNTKTARRFAQSALTKGDINMERPIWVQKMTDKKLKQLLEDIQSLEYSCSTKEYIRQIANTWYIAKTDVERLMLMMNDCYKEAAFRWMSNM